MPRLAAHLLAALLLAVAAPQAAHAGKVLVACEDLTGVDYCTECTTTAGVKKCLACYKDRAPVWAPDSKITECRATTTAAAARTASGDPQCARADGQWCIECNKGFFFNAQFKCVASTAATAAAKTLDTCQKTSNNPDCTACNPDGTCALCRNNMIVVPLNAMFINAAWRESQCKTLAQLNAEAKAITWVNAVVPAGCVEVDSDFKCNRCGAGKSLVNSQCVADVGCGGDFKPYCSRCNAAKTACTVCNGSRSIVGGACALPCKLLFGIGCRKCTAAVCTDKDPAYANGRR